MFPYCETQFLSSLVKMSQLASIQPAYIQLVPMEHFQSESDCGEKEKLKRIEFKMNKRNLKWSFHVARMDQVREAKREFY